MDGAIRLFELFTNMSMPAALAVLGIAAALSLPFIISTVSRNNRRRAEHEFAHKLLMEEKKGTAVTIIPPARND